MPFKIFFWFVPICTERLASSSTGLSELWSFKLVLQCDLSNFVTGPLSGLVRERHDWRGVHGIWQDSCLLPTHDTSGLTGRAPHAFYSRCILCRNARLVYDHTWVWKSFRITLSKPMSHLIHVIAYRKSLHNNNWLFSCMTIIGEMICQLGWGFFATRTSTAEVWEQAHSVRFQSLSSRA